ncbi:vanadium-dependent haloperoxidase [Ramlibacter sp. PS4R-6]|uniref:vanadium-dependent haloperoxidase n=1 Tax=Ramlibacter sp. PS4R-6 TaxID=3133438 RepID=UPI0030A50B1B
MKAQRILTGLAAALAIAGFSSARADAVTDWNTKAGELIAEARMGTPPAVRLMALVQTAVHDAVKAARPGQASVDAAVAAANRAVLARALPTQEQALGAAYQAAIAAIPENASRAAGIEIGEKAAAAVLAARADDGAATPEAYRPAANAGSYVPTVVPAVPQWAQRKPWLMARPDEFRPAPPPDMKSALWVRDFEEVKGLGSRTSTRRTAEQTEIARFWEFSLPSIYFGVVRSVAATADRDVARNARLYAAVAQGMDDAMISVMDAKYHYQFWRPVTAIRNADKDGNDATERDAGWVSLIDSPMHPEYPSAHSILAGTVGAVLKAELGRAPVPVLTTTSGSLKGVTRRWTRIDDFMQEVAEARIYEGIHYRNSTEIGLAMGRRIGTLAAQRHLERAD